MLLSHSVQGGVLVITVYEDPGADARAALQARIGDLVQAHRPSTLVMILDEPAAARPVIGVVLRVHRLCARLGILMSVATHSAPARHLLETWADGLDGTRLVVHARIDTAIAGATALAVAA
ncbi:hypothetical protein [Streptomyces sp. NBC_00582]|uniref:hypothetical protein n=1 Tax=Streptomyces sp. NBC_00582 TaxID=2975783 RepID=UPI002E812A12|nr:hypothetical protein [Streptomyces sp. NBC_00582]WUB66899.1 hypothetical protein OG852_44115 [Streptomyces sp. NBC_00582]